MAFERNFSKIVLTYTAPSPIPSNGKDGFSNNFLNSPAGNFIMKDIGHYEGQPFYRPREKNEKLFMEFPGNSRTHPSGNFITPNAGSGNHRHVLSFGRRGNLFLVGTRSRPGGFLFGSSFPGLFHHPPLLQFDRGKSRNLDDLI